ncbi:peptidoglycan/LPS O-acetylase OafA/YrhL [Pseudarthrobacter defluvii]|uniref:hypothetical protein n=1 Tax=Pseudarthrobacter defluvii TaxID=410837 RepID=UPI00277E12FA|nr:hypothetical protein [Pseudarthrobacter defluvii]MDQ0771109.1 peptidoglycan/LPS O-acetylase OafA/YrhL [Pseudarthrobacter defluvii]
MLESFMHLPRPTPPANHRHVQQSDLPAEQIYTLVPAPKGRLAGCVIAFLLGSWMLAVPVALIDQLKNAPGPAAGIVSGIVIALGVATAGLGGFLFFNARDRRRPWPYALIASLAATVVAAVISASQPEYGLLLAVPALVAGVPALIVLAKDTGRP